jgi:hypothetical protein
MMASLSASTGSATPSKNTMSWSFAFLNLKRIWELAMAAAVAGAAQERCKRGDRSLARADQAPCVVLRRAASSEEVVTVAAHRRAVAVPAPTASRWDGPRHALTCTHTIGVVALRCAASRGPYPRPRFPAPPRAAAVTVAPSSSVPTSSTSSQGGRSAALAAEAVDDEPLTTEAAEGAAATAGDCCCGHRSRNQLPSLGTSTWRSWPPPVAAPPAAAAGVLEEADAPSPPPPSDGTASVRWRAVLATT